MKSEIYSIAVIFNIINFRKIKINNYQRSAMSQKRLTSLGIISIEFEIAESLNYDGIIRDLAYTKARKIKC